MFGHDPHPADIRQQDIDEAEEQLRRLQSTLADHEERLAEIVGTGEGERGYVRATAASDGQVIAVVLDPRAVKDGSRALSEQILLAVQRARQDALRQADALLQEALREALPGSTIDLAALQEQARGLLD